MYEMNTIEVICRRCGRKAPADEFRVDHIYKLAVCKVCFTDRKKDLPKKTQTTQNVKEDKVVEESSKQYEIKRSKLFDDDEYLEKAIQRKKEEFKKKRENAVKVRLLKENKALYPCPHCSYKFKYNIETETPTKCPYCGKKVNPNIDF